MKRIKAIYFERLRAEAHLQLLRVFRAMVEAGVATRDLLREQLPKLDQLLATRG
jgi:hypothetical protein